MLSDYGYKNLSALSGHSIRLLQQLKFELALGCAPSELDMPRKSLLLQGLPGFHRIKTSKLLTPYLYEDMIPLLVVNSHLVPGTIHGYPSL